MKLPGEDDSRFDNAKSTEKSLATFQGENTGPWRDDTQVPKPCWTKPTSGLFTLIV